MLLYMLWILCIYYCTGLKSSDTRLNLQFVIPGSNDKISTTLSTQIHQDVTFYKIIRSVLYFNTIIMDCTFTFDTSSFNRKPLICDINTACISTVPSDHANGMKLHLENLGIGDLGIIEIKRVNQDLNYEESLFYDTLLCIGDSAPCDGHRYIDFISNPSTQTLEISPINSQIHNKLQCDSKDTQYDSKDTQYDFKDTQYDSTQTVPAPHQNYNDQEEDTISAKYTILGSQRKLSFASPSRYNYHHKTMNTINSKDYYMDILLTIVLLIMVLLSAYNMSYFVNQFKNNDQYSRMYDTRRV